MHVRRFAAVLSIATLGLVVAACSSGGSSSGGTGSSGTSTGGASGVIKLGVLISQTGDFAAQGQAHLGSIKLGVALVNDAGGIIVDGKKYTFSLVTADAASDPATATAAAKGLINDDGINFLIGPGDSATVVPVAALIEKSPDVLWIAGSTYVPTELAADGTSGGYSNTFATNTPASTVYPTAVKGALEFEPNAKTAVLLWPSTAAYDPYAVDIQNAFTSHGIKVVSTIRYDPSTTDFTPLLTRIKSADPDILFTGTTSGAVAAIVSQAEQLGSPFKSIIVQGVFAGPGLTGDNGGPPAFPYMYIIPRGIDQFSGVAAVNNLFKEYQQVNGSPVSVDAEGYATEFTSSIELLAKAIEKAGSFTNVAAVSQALAEVSVSTPVGTVHYNSTHILQAPLGVCRLVGGKGGCKVLVAAAS
jgi:branched-chain amino acid transport system substrate-binding protein